MLPEDLYPASYRGALFYLSVADTSGGRKDAQKEIVNSDRQIIEDLGKRQRDFTLRAVIAPQYSNTGTMVRTYQVVRDTLLAALEKGDVGVLIHPFQGRIENVACRTFEMSESVDSLGMTGITITFGISNTTGTPQPEEASLSTIVAKNEAAWVALNSAVSVNYEVSSENVDNHGDALTKVTDFVDDMRDATNQLTQISSKIDAYNAQLNDLASSAASLVLTPTSLAESVSALFTSTRALLATPKAIFDAMQRLFIFGTLDNFIPLDTTSRIERQKNRDLMNVMIQGGALNDAYGAAAKINFPTVDEIDEASRILEDQYQAMVTAAAWESDVETALTEARIATSEYFVAQRAVKPRLVTIDTHTTPARVLAYTYYGSSDRGETIAKLNGVDDAAFVEGEVQILSS
jgi:prophage DNA circulation protein